MADCEGRCVQVHCAVHQQFCRRKSYAAIVLIQAGLDQIMGFEPVQLRPTPFDNDTVTKANATIQTITNIATAAQDGIDVVVEVGSGSYDFEYPYR